MRDYPVLPRRKKRIETGFGCAGSLSGSSEKRDQQRPKEETMGPKENLGGRTHRVFKRGREKYPRDRGLYSKAESPLFRMDTHWISFKETIKTRIRNKRNG